LYDFPLQSDDEMAAYLGLLAVFEIFKVIPVLLGCGSWICRIVDCNAIDLLQGNGRPGVVVDSQKLYIQRRCSFPGNLLLQLSFLFLLLLAGTVPYCPGSQDQEKDGTGTQRKDDHIAPSLCNSF